MSDKESNTQPSSSTDPTEENTSLDSDSGININWSCIKKVIVKICSYEGITYQVVLNALLSTILGIPIITYFTSYVGDITSFVISHQTIFQIIGGLIVLLGKIAYSGGFLPLETLFKLVIGTLNIDSNALLALPYQLISVLILVLAFAYHRKYGNLPDFEELEQIKAKLEAFRQTMAYDDDGTTLHVSFFRKVLEIFCLHNAWIPDTWIMLYFATLTNWSVWVYLSGTLVSGLTLGWLETTAWMTELREIMIQIQQDGGASAWDLIEGISIETSLLEKIFIYLVGSCGVCFIVYRFYRILRIFCLIWLWKKLFASQNSEESSHILKDVDTTLNISEDV